jgi:hypothetical protein
MDISETIFPIYATVLNSVELLKELNLETKNE